MTAPRRIEPGKTYLITRRCTQREFLLRPDPELNAIIAYCLAEASRRFEVKLIAWDVLSNHYHNVVHDTHGRLPAFLEHFHKMTAKAVNALRGRRENMWSSEETCVTLLVRPEDVLEKVIYTLTNPVAAGLVDRSVDWPGLHSLGHLDGKPTMHTRPKWYFKSKSKVMPEAVPLQAVVPPGFKMDAAQWAAKVKAGVAVRERLLRAKRAKKRLHVLGRAAVLATAPSTRPAKKDRGSKIRPEVACKDEKRRIEELGRLKAFRVEYAEKRRRYIAAKTGSEKQKVVFPPGTYALRALGVRCAPFGDRLRL